MKNFKHIYYLSFLLLIIPVTNCLSAILTVNSIDEMNPESLRQLVNIAEDGDTIIFNSTIDDKTPIVLTEGEILIEKKISILGTTDKLIILDANYNSRIFAINSNGELTLNRIKLVNGDKSVSFENGGAIWNAGSLNLKDCIFENNKASQGGAIYTSNQLNINRSFFNNNQAVRYGGAVYYEGFANDEHYKPIINRAIFTNNTTTESDGGAFYNDGYGGNSSPIFLNCIFAWNMANDDGAVMFNNAHYGVSSPLIINCTIFGNQAGDEGSVVSSYGPLGIAIATFYNSIIWNNDSGNGESFANNNSQTIISYCIIEESSCPEGCNCNDDLGMIYNKDPQFSTTNDFTGELSIVENLSLSENSPAINQGNNDYILDFAVDFDILGNTRIFDGTVDMGAFEYNEIIPNYTFMFDLKVYLEGAFDANTGLMRSNLANLSDFPITSPFENIIPDVEPESIILLELDDIIDWLCLEFRTSPDGENIYSKSVLLKDDGSIIDVYGEQNFAIELPQFSSLYIVIRHKNHLDIMSQEIIWNENQSLIEYDFTNSISQAYGSLQQKELAPSLVGMFAGDINWDNTIQTSDYDAWKQTPAVLQIYSPLDLTLDGLIQITDFDVWFVNKAKLGLPNLALDN